ncbi:hypothetical protein DN752_21140 [Echinicola strongylocentroti]|uniref:SprB repeat-containing protein n=1 Tax=Echinicola strongylocentroti TaxID=1795355 RepID=A0A2Z4INW6_9BACT|nr:SprB repeat-containing protein [Echinicola strongylocentroti]AWW32449.1 hypothetical protein DN752_21140 [Echinicola strongylocentroti]
MATKTYAYEYGGVPGTVDVTVNITACIVHPVDTNLTQGFLNIEVELSEALPFGLPIHFDVDYVIYTQTGNRTGTFPITLEMPANETSHTFEDQQCYYEVNDPYDREQLDYNFVDQPEPYVEGTPLAVSVISQEDATCHGQANGSITVEASGGSGGYSYTWSDGGADSPLRTSIPAGTYSVIVEDSNGNTASVTDIIVGEPPQIELATDITPVTCFGGNNGAVDITPSGGNGAPYTFQWSDGSTAQNRTNLTAGNYQVTVVDSGGCSRSFVIPVIQPTQITITVNQSGRDVVNDVAGGTAPYTYYWSDGYIIKDRADIPVGTYTFTVTDANGCQQSTIISIQDTKFYFSKNPVWLTLQAADPETKPNLSFVCEVFLEEDYESENFLNKFESEHPAREDGSTDFNVEQVLNAFLDAKVPEFGDTEVKMVGEAFKRFYLRYYEKYGEPPLPDATSQVDTYYILYGGLSEQEFAKHTFFATYLDNQKPFLTWQPNAIPVATDQHAYLHFVCVDEAVNDLILKVYVYYNDGTSVTANVKSITSVKPYELYRFPSGVPQLEIAALNPAKTIHYYELQLFSGAAQVSEKRKFEVYKPKRHFKKLLFLNSVGGWDSVLCRGRGSQSLRTSEETISREMPVGFSYQDREEETVSKQGTITGDYVIANMNGYTRRHLIDLAISEKVYEQTNSGYLPVLVKFDFDPEEDYENIDEVSIDIIYPTIRRYTPEL